MRTRICGAVSLVTIVGCVTVLCGAVSGLYITQAIATKLANETFFVLCRDESGRSVTWHGPSGVLLGTKTRPKLQVSSYGTAILFNRATVEDSGVYTCSVGEEKQAFHLTVEAPLTFMDTSLNQTGIEGRDVNLRCEVRGGKVTWSIEGADINDANKYTIMGDGLLIKNVQRTDSRNYICKAVQPSTGMVVDRRIKLRVLHQPIFPHPVYAKPEHVYGYINGFVNLTCIVIADPSARFQWMKNQDRIEKAGRIFSVADDVSVLQLRIEKNTFGVYKCIATNPYGKIEKVFRLEEGTKPDPPDFIELRGANSDLLDFGIHGPTLNQDASKHMEPIGYTIKYRHNTHGAHWRTKEFNISEDNSYPLQYLHHNSIYEVKAATRNAAGLSDFTNISTFQTLPYQGDGAPHDTAILFWLPAFAMITSAFLRA